MQQPILSFLFSAPSDRCHQVRFCILSFANKQSRHTNIKELGVGVGALHCQLRLVSFIEHNENVELCAFSSMLRLLVFGVRWIPCKQDNIKSYNCWRRSPGFQKECVSQNLNRSQTARLLKKLIFKGTANADDVRKLRGCMCIFRFRLCVGVWLILKPQKTWHWHWCNLLWCISLKCLDGAGWWRGEDIYHHRYRQLCIIIETQPCVKPLLK